LEEILDDEAPKGAFLKTAAKVAKSGFALLAKPAFQARLEACGTCALAIKKDNTITCSSCGCDMGIKARFSATECPINPDW
jgi:hypothetical protein